jgi:5,10-methylenetetrahydromethanopterin reductase
MERIRTSVRLPSGTPIETFRAAARMAETAGFDQIWTGNDLFRRSGIVPVAVALDSTERISIGSSVLNPVSLHPAEIAMIASNLQELSGGRYLLGMGAGSEVFLRWAGLEPDVPVTRTSQGIRAVRALLDGLSPADRPRTGDGWMPQAILKDGPARPTPIYLGGMGPKMLELGGRLADGVLALALPPERYAWIAERVAAGAEGREIDIACAVWIAIDDDPDIARGLLAEKIAIYAGSLSRDGLEQAGLDVDRFQDVQRLMSAGDAAAAVALVDDGMLRLGIAGDATTVIDRCAELVAAGARHLSFGQPLGARPLDAIAFLGDRVLPRFAKEFA